MSQRTPLDASVSERGWTRDRSPEAAAFEHEMRKAGSEPGGIWHQRLLTVIVGREPLGPKRELRWHLSISHPNRYPTWDEIAAARYGLVPDEAQMVMLLPPRAEYVNLHDTTFHLHEVPEARA